MRRRFGRSFPALCTLVFGAFIFVTSMGCSSEDLPKQPDPGGDGGHTGSSQGTGGQGTGGQGTGGQGTGGRGTGGQGTGGRGTGGRPVTCGAAPPEPCAVGWVRNYSVVCGRGGQPGTITCASPTGDGLCYQKCTPSSGCPDPCFSRCEGHHLYISSYFAETTYFCGS